MDSDALLCSTIARQEEHFKAHWLAHTEETDEERIREIMKRADEDAAWIVDKYTGAGK